MTSVPQCSLIFFSDTFCLSLQYQHSSSAPYSPSQPQWSQCYHCCCFVILRNHYTNDFVHYCDVTSCLLSQAAVLLHAGYCHWMWVVTYGVTQRALLTHCAQFQEFPTNIASCIFCIWAYSAHSKGRGWGLEAGFNHVILHIKANKPVCSWTSQCVQWNCPVKKERYSGLANIVFLWHF